jgi:hypothetical protein
MLNGTPTHHRSGEITRMRSFSWRSVITVLLPFGGCAPLGPATEASVGTPLPSLSAARAVSDSIGAGRIIVVDTLHVLDAEPLPPEREIARIRVVRGRKDGCYSATRTTVDCPTIIWVETRRPQWIPR